MTRYLSKDTVGEILKRHKNGETLRQLAKEYGMSERTLSSYHTTKAKCKICHRPIASKEEVGPHWRGCVECRQSPDPEILKQRLLLRRFIISFPGMDSPCWLYSGAKSNTKYAALKFKGRSYQVHRLSMFVFKGFDLNSQNQINHHCDNPSCINPSHLYEGNYLTNRRDAIVRGRAYMMGRIPKLNFARVREIRERFIPGNGENTKRLAREFGIKPATIYDVVSGRRKIWQKAEGKLVMSRKRKLILDQVREIRKRYIPGKRGYPGSSNAKELAKEFGIHKDHLASVAKEKYWKEKVPDELTIVLKTGARGQNDSPNS